MKQYCLKILAKNEKSVKNFLHFFFNYLKTKSNIIQKSSSANRNRKIVTLLKSPHVDKTAQEHFELRILKKEILIKSFCLKKDFIFLKKVLNRLFQDISINLTFTIAKKVDQKNKQSLFYLNNVRLQTGKSTRTNLNRYKQKTL